jgi:hypothetical protein
LLTQIIIFKYRRFYIIAVKKEYILSKNNYYEDNRDNLLANQKKRRKEYLSLGKCGDCGKRTINFTRSKSRCDFCLDRSKRTMAKYIGDENYNKNRRSYTHDIRIKAMKKIANLNNIPLICPRCGCLDINFLTINHINHDGSKERNKSSSIQFYYNIINGKRNTKDLNLLCKVCNWIYTLEKTSGKKWIIKIIE